MFNSNQKGRQHKQGDVVWQYQIDRPLGTGAFGSVYQAHHTSMKKRVVALKQLRTSQRSSSTVNRFKRESIAMGELKHPNVIFVYELIDPEIYPNVDNYYIVMEYLDGGTLRDWIDNPEQPLKSLGDVIRIIKDVCLGLSAAHHEQIFHRDIKPENILLSKDGKQVKIGDWGLAHMDQFRITDTNVVMGTMDYMAPEQAAGYSADVDGRADLYSVGVIFYEILTGELPLDLQGIADEAAERLIKRSPLDAANRNLLDQARRTACLRAIESAPRRDPRSIVPNLPINLAKFLTKAIAIEPAKRFQSAEEFITELDRVAVESRVKPTTESDQRGAQIAAMLVQARQYRTEHSFTEAVEVLEKARGMVGDEIGVLLELARTYNVIGQPQAALRVLQQALQLDSDNYVILRDIGITYGALNDRTRACEMLQRSLKLNPNQSHIKVVLKNLQSCP